VEQADLVMGTADANPAPRPYPSQYISVCTLRDGTPVTIRPIRPADEPLMVKFHGTLSDRTVYLRYFLSLSLNRRTTHERLLKICFGDYLREMVLVAELKDVNNGEARIIAVGRLNKLESGNEGEVAVLVSDSHQCMGIGTELLCRLIQVARDEKLTSLVAETLRDNIAIQKILKTQKFTLRSIEEDPGTIRATLQL
jgi:acetyltransferase